MLKKVLSKIDLFNDSDMERLICRFIFILPFFMWIIPESFSLLIAWYNPHGYNPNAPTELLFYWLVSSLMALLLGIFVTKSLQLNSFKWVRALWKSQFFAILLSSSILVLSLWLISYKIEKVDSFSMWISEWSFHYLMTCVSLQSMLWLGVIVNLNTVKTHKARRVELYNEVEKGLIIFPIMWVFLPELLNTINCILTGYGRSFSATWYGYLVLAGLSSELIGILLLSIARKKEEGYEEVCLNTLKKAIFGVGSVAFFLVVTTLLQLYSMLHAHGLTTISSEKIIHLIVLNKLGSFFLVLACVFLLHATQRKIKKRLLSFSQTNKTSGRFGSAKWAEEEELQKANLYNVTNGIFSGTDIKGRNIFLPLANKLTIAPPKGGKTSSSTIPVLLSHEGAVFVFDIKGELWATTARYRHEKMGRKIVAIDPYRLRELPEFAEGKPVELLQDYAFNPFDWIPEKKEHRDRMINAFASSFVLSEGGNAIHFDENARILIRGYLDYMIQMLPDKDKKMTTLFTLMCESLDEAMLTFEQMRQLEGRAGAAANQISRVGADERGSILSTSYRQIDWLSDSNIQHVLEKSNFDLADFVKGNMDIYVILPEDQVKEHHRLVRMLLSLLLGLIVQTPPSQLPKQKMLLLLDELAQLGYCPDVEQCIEVLRARGVVVWTAFQALSQIEVFEKADLFKGTEIKQIFTCDDVDTMKWIQDLGGKKTISTKSYSTNSGDTKQQLQIVGGSVSKGESESIQEAGTELIHINEIRELPVDEQFIFIHGMKPIRCKKVRYFETSLFSGKYDKNPIEQRNELN